MQCNRMECRQRYRMCLTLSQSQCRSMLWMKMMMMVQTCTLYNSLWWLLGYNTTNLLSRPILTVHQLMMIQLMIRLMSQTMIQMMLTLILLCLLLMMKLLMMVMMSWTSTTMSSSKPGSYTTHLMMTLTNYTILRTNHPLQIHHSNCPQNIWHC